MAIDLSIRNWGASNPSLYPPGWPLWTTPDIYVDNNGNRTLTTRSRAGGFPLSPECQRERRTGNRKGG